MLNKVILMGRITQNLEVKQTPSGVAVLQFSLAVERQFKNADGEKETDFINCVAWRQQAEFIGKYFGKGRMIALEGNLRTRTYDDKNGVKHYVTEVYVDNVSFTGEKSDDCNSGVSQAGNETGRQQNSKSKPPVHNTQEYDDNMSLYDFDGVLSDDGLPF